MSPAPGGFSYEQRGSEVRILHRGRHATTLRGLSAEQFLADVGEQDPQELMARVTGQ